MRGPRLLDPSSLLPTAGDATHHLINGFLDRVRHDLRLIDHGVMHGLVEQLLVLHGVLSDGGVEHHSG